MYLCIIKHPHSHTPTHACTCVHYGLLVVVMALLELILPKKLPWLSKVCAS